ncbi:LexA family protein [Marinomonas shanghaiensis]|uniref:LexA family protein n=1 Tax=Marinomonas shanghaiensis TaxID=2202418 RepID=UPI003A95767D
MDISDRIRQKMTERQLKAVDLARATGASKGSVSQWLNGINSPGGKYITPLCKVLGCDSTWLFTGIGISSLETKESNLAIAPAQSDSKYLPVISQVQAGEWAEAIDYRSLGDDIEWEVAPNSVSDNSFWLKVVGDSMTSPIGVSIAAGHLILVDPNGVAENGSLVVALLEGTNEVTFKKLVIDAGQKYLMPLNPNYRPIEINGNCRIVGVVKEARVKL